MLKLNEMRMAADLLLKQKNYGKALIIYDELFREIMGLLGELQSRYVLYKAKNNRHPQNAYVPFYERYINVVGNLLCLKKFNKTLMEVASELAYILCGRIQCICSSPAIMKSVTYKDVLSEFYIFYQLIASKNNGSGICNILTYFAIIPDGYNKMRKIVPNITLQSIEAGLIQSVDSIIDTKWKFLNSLLLKYISSISIPNIDFYNYLKSKLDTFAHEYEKKQKNSWDEKFNKGMNNSNNNQDKSRYAYNEYTYANYSGYYPSTDKEKEAYYARVIDLRGKVTKSEIRQKYLQLIAQYHPDKVQHLGPELRELAERKTKEINAAYEWFKARYNI